MLWRSKEIFMWSVQPGTQGWHYMLLVSLSSYTQELTRAFCLSVCGWWTRKSAAHIGRNLAPASLASGSKQITRPRHWPWKGACTAGHFIQEFHPVAKTVPNTVFLLKWLPPPYHHPAPSDLCPIEDLFPFIAHLAFLPQPAGRV